MKMANSKSLTLRREKIPLKQPKNLFTFRLKIRNYKKKMKSTITKTMQANLDRAFQCKSRSFKEEATAFLPTIALGLTRVLLIQIEITQITNDQPTFNTRAIPTANQPTPHSPPISSTSTRKAEGSTRPKAFLPTTSVF